MDTTAASAGCASNGLSNDAVSSNAVCTSDELVAKEVRIWMDGAFDMMHFGHMNAFRLGKALGMSLSNSCLLSIGIMMLTCPRCCNIYTE